MPVALMYATNEDRKALLDILFIPEVKVTLDLLPTDTSESLLERIGDNTDNLPMVCCINVVLDKHINAELNRYGLFFTKQEPLLMGHLPTLKYYGSRKFYPNPLLVGVNDHTAIKDYKND